MTAMLATSFDRAGSIWGLGDLDAHFHGGDRASVPWGRAPKVRPGPTESARRARLLEGLRRPVQLVDVDARSLLASQPMVVRHHARYYLGDEWALTGVTSADMTMTANRFPVIEVGDRGDLIIRTGHHRALVALLTGRPLQARLVDTRHDEHDPIPGLPVISITPTLSLVESGVAGSDSSNCVSSLSEAESWMTAHGLDQHQIQDRLVVSQGRPTQLDR